MVEHVRPANARSSPMIAKAAEMALALCRLTGAAVSRRGTYAKASAECVDEFLGARW